MGTNKQLKYIIAFTLIVSSIFIIFLIFKASHILENLNASAKKDAKVLILTSDNLNDQSWGGLAYKGKILIEDEYNISAEVIGSVNENKDTADLVKTYVNKGYQLIIGHGREFSEPFYRLMNQYKDVQFATIHGQSTGENLSVYTFNQNEVEVVAGMAAAMKTETNRIAIIDAVDNYHKDWGFPDGVEKINPDVSLTYKLVPERTNKQKAKEVAASLIDSGVDVIYTKGNSYNQAVINYAKEQGIYLIGYLEDQSYMAEELMLTSVTNDVPMAYNAIIKDYLSEKGLPHSKKMLNESDGVYGLAPLGPMFTEYEIEQMQTVTDVEIPY
ncbi:BMP family ABC transporter substrate-binding protein [Gracilibacillus caseinilyticus]|uniref:BMP family ABC transporter substrate-binding protein n=1 Tax=Gracilibacillus caseinilyticus TaxID=2932256 RepID=A0ABY4ESW1_9BACI|nr:BMP family ABC transporter substrate-binding protein [Gracilibacillus caseinilyticus]UOQ47511.1 BMP family ABC transporter substrate-binding protein [Gracilibacillus caseinilyticus]